MRGASRFLVLPLLGLALSLMGAAGGLEHEHLRIRNTFKTPDEVVGYYCSRDASGFVWSGLLDAERQAFTFWHDAPQQDSFFIAKKYEIGPAQYPGDSSDRAVVEVQYDLAGIGDAHGTRFPPPANPHVVRFELRRVSGTWKIAKPEWNTVSPVVLESKFRYTTAQP